MGRYTQDPPFAIQIELSEGCPLRCTFCGLNGIRLPAPQHDYKLMELRTAERVASEMARLGWTARVEFAMHGEPTMNPDAAQIVKTFRDHLPKTHLMMTSNGFGLLGGKGPVEKLNDLFDAGLNVFGFDAYESVKIKDRLLPMLESEGANEERRFEVMYYPEDPEASIHARRPVSARVFVRVKDISVADTGNHSVLNNHCGAGAPPLREPIRARCAKPFRELSVRWDGSVAICCNDWRGVYKINNVRALNLDVLWNHERFTAARKHLLRGDRKNLAPCNVCDAKSYRVGLLPDKMGKKTMSAPTKKDQEIVMRAIKGRPLTAPIKREWEE